jgi:hypothetical protein
MELIGTNDMSVSQHKQMTVAIQDLRGLERKKSTARTEQHRHRLE